MSTTDTYETMRRANQVATWNATVPVGTQVMVRSHTGGEEVRYRTDSQARMLGGAAVVGLEGKSGCHDVDFIRVLAEPVAAAAAATDAKLTAARAAVKHVLNLSQTDADVGYLIAPLTQSFTLLCTAEAAIDGKPVAEVTEARSRSLARYPRRLFKRSEIEDEIQREKDDLEGDDGA